MKQSITTSNKFCQMPKMFLFNLAMYLLCYSVEAVIMPPRLHSSTPDAPQTLLKGSPNLTDDDYEVPYVLSINEGESIDVKIRSSSSISINLNRAVSEDINVTLSVNSRPDLITFDSPSNSTQPFNSTNNTVTIIYKADTFGDRIVGIHANDAAGHAEIVCKVLKQPSGADIDFSTAFISVNIGKSWVIRTIIVITGWIYFVAWSASFYFQVILNYQRKSVTGLNFDFLALNLMGFTCYAIYNFSLMFSREAQENYYKRHEYSRIPVEVNDLFFAVHAVLLTLITIIQCFIYERGDQKVSIPTIGFITLASLGGVGCLITHVASVETLALLDVLMYFSYVKLVITLIKYTPQAYMNYKRKATTGWSIHNILLDFTGGIFSIGQMFLISYNFDDWTSIFGNFTKFGLGVISITFDILFVIQHYFLYRQVGQLDVSTESIPSPVINRSIISSSYKQPSDDEDSDQPPAPATTSEQQNDNQ